MIFLSESHSSILDETMEVNRWSALNGPSIENLSDAGRVHCSNARKALASHTMHESVAKNCLLNGCYICADLKEIDDEMSTAYEHIFDLIQRREQIIKKPDHDPFIHRLPVEILSLTFVFVKEAYDDETNDDEIGGPSYGQPCTSPPLLVGAVCKKWRDITLRTPQLWTDILVDLVKPADGQVDMVNEWARRSGALPVKIEVWLEEADFLHECRNSIPKGRRNVAQALRSLAIRWNNVVLFVPWYFCHDLFDDLEEFLSISSFHLFLVDECDTVLDPIKLRHPLRPKCFCSDIEAIEMIPFEWDNLVHLEIASMKDEQLALHIMRHAQNLRHWDVELDVMMSGAALPKPTTYITHRVLTYFKTDLAIMSHLILPSLQQLHYSTGRGTLSSTEQIDSLSDFVNRSCPPLQTFSVYYDIHHGDPGPCFKKLPGITSLHLIINHSRARDPVRTDPFLHALMQPPPDAILPRLAEFSFNLPYMPRSSWSLFSRLFQKNIQPDTPHSNVMKANGTMRRPLSKIRIRVQKESRMDKDTFLHLLAVKKSGFDLDLTELRGNLFDRMAERYDVTLSPKFRLSLEDSEAWIREVGNS